MTSVAAPLSQRSRPGSERIESVEPGVLKILVTADRFVNRPTGRAGRETAPDLGLPDFHRKR
ncbi:hypothetical protein QFW96_13455 [Saccharopolyspora sp. TS4A08]|uniref:Uncharacterized protein n=1 Tax=Saccharopolyspora ipomoeae TaxID=3042027 RepID=A0ABT6PNQ2_9PSEU|nr:hypothetical protein [Saccharopolyspora sp. TS4A08]MDI2029631.1 hypothetical protein [Saccharopolyspora sp. TS4A08]